MLGRYRCFFVQPELGSLSIPVGGGVVEAKRKHMKPTVDRRGVVAGKTVIMGVSPTETVLLLLTIGLTALTFLGQRASALHGMLHLTLFAVFGVLLFVT